MVNIDPLNVAVYKNVSTTLDVDFFFFFFFYGPATHIGPWPPLYEVP
jgi:hypothetical protein